MPKFLAQVDTSRIPIKGLLAEPSPTPPTDPVEGLQWHDTANKQLKVYLNGSWQQCDNQGVAASSHIHSIAQVTGLQAAIDGKASSTHGHALTDSNITGVLPIAQVPTAASGVSSATAVPLANDSRLSNSRTPSGAAGGDFEGTYPNPTLKSGVVTDAKVASANKDGNAGTPSMRTLGFTGTQAMPGDTKLDQIAVPTSPVNVNNQRVTNVATPTTANDAANKAYVDAAVQGLDIFDSVRIATTANITLSGLTAIDGVTPVAGNRILVKNQTTASQNGIYIAASGAWSRAADFPAGTSVSKNAFLFVEEGVTQADSGWVMTNDGIVTIGTTALTFAQFSGAGQVEAGTGLNKTGNTLSVKYGTAAGTAAQGNDSRLSDARTPTAHTHNASDVNAGTLDVARIPDLPATKITSGVVSVGVGGTGATTSALARRNLKAAGYSIGPGPAFPAGQWVNIPHSLENACTVTCYEVSSGEEIVLDKKFSGTNSISLKSDIDLAGGSVLVMITG